MRRFLITAISVFLVISFIGFSAGVALAKSGPYLPGDTLFTIQYYAEQQISWYGNEIDRAEQYLGLMERRLGDLVELTGSSYEIDAIVYLDGALDQAIQAVIKVSDEEAPPFREKLLNLVMLTEVAIHRLTVAPNQNPNQIGSFLAKLSTIQAIAVDSQFTFNEILSILEGDLTSINQSRNQDISHLEDQQISGNPMDVPFPADSPASQHEFYPLEGTHALLECTDCHNEGVYDGTSNWCEACHVDDKPVDHYIGDCGVCHTPDSWEDAEFDHTQVRSSDCVLCHVDVKPDNHIGNQCGACHNTNAWTPATFNHKAVGATDCLNCHTNDRPVNHYDGQCSSCHNTDNWKNVTFNHKGQTNCQSCHNSDKPSRHYDGQCSSCHNTDNWWNVNFNHSGQTNCQGCHNSDKPSGHYGGQCSSCHNTNNWRNAHFNHSGQTDCKSCHKGDRPSGHFSGQCSQCHNTNKWGDANFNHSAQTDCIACHAGDRPRDHSNKQCSQCHNQRDWDDADDDDGKDGDSDGKEDDDDEKGSTGIVVNTIYAWNNSRVDCNTCHMNISSPGDTESAKSLASFLGSFMKIIRNKFDA